MRPIDLIFDQIIRMVKLRNEEEAWRLVEVAKDKYNDNSCRELLTALLRSKNKRKAA